MKLLSLFTLIAATTATALPTLDTPTLVEERELEERQSFGTKWNEPYISQPRIFQIRNAGAQCNFQLAYERSNVDNRYDVQYLAEYADGSSASISGIRGSLPRDHVWIVDGFSESRGLQVVFFRDICKGGAAPRSFRANFSLRSGFTYSNRWTTGSLSLSTGTLPAAPQNVRLRASSSPRTSTVTWSAVQGATGYVVLMEWFTGSEVGPLPFVWAREVPPSASSYTYNRQFSRAAVVAITGGTIPNGAKSFTPLDGVVDVYPS